MKPKKSHKIEKNKNRRQTHIIPYEEITNTIGKAQERASEGKIQSAETMIRDLIRKYPARAEVHQAYGIICGLDGRNEEAISHFNKALAIDPNYIDAWFNKAAVYHSMLDLVNVIRSFQKVIELGDSSDEVVHSALNSLKDYAKIVKKTSGLNLTDYLKGWDEFEQAMILMSQKKWEDAIKGFEKVLSINPKHIQSYGNMGICLAKLGSIARAKAAYDMALKIDPNYAPAIENKKIAASLKEGEKLEGDILATDYYKGLLRKKHEE